MPALEIIFVGVLFAVAVNIFAWPRSKKGGRSCSHNAVIRVYDGVGNVIDTHKQRRFQRPAIRLDAVVAGSQTS